MRNLFRSLGVSLAVVGAFMLLGAADAAEGRAGYNANYSSPSTRAGLAPDQQRMPSMPKLPGINVVGSGGQSVSGVVGGGGGSTGGGGTGGGGTGGGGTGGCVPGQSCTCPDGSVGVCLPNGSCDCRTKPPVTDCPDGGVRNSEYSVEMCMNDILGCINNGALPGGLNDLFNEDLRNAIFNGMSLCYIQVERCVAEVRRDCRNVYNSSSDVWWDFNSRKVQPEYYSFILRKTGLTPNQAENTCLLLDRNTYGSSFNAATGNKVTSEYNNRVGAYNNQIGNTLIKTNPQGVAVNTHGAVDANRGHYARWDATTGECLIRIAAYNKDSHIKNSWLFGAAGDDKPAEVWTAAGETFSCNKDLFGFSLLNKTSTVAVVGIGGGTLAGAGIGAIAGHGKRNFDCNIRSHRKKLTEQLIASGQVAVVNEFLPADVQIRDAKADDICEEVVMLYDTYQRALLVDKNCAEMGSGVIEAVSIGPDNFNYTTGRGEIDFNWVDYMGQKRMVLSDERLSDEQKNLIKECRDGGSECAIVHIGVNLAPETVLDRTDLCPKYPSMNRAYVEARGFYECNDPLGNCISVTELRNQIGMLNKVFRSLPILTEGEKSNMLGSTLIGAGVGAGAGGLATAITSFVEKSNISCRVGDGLEKISYGKSHSLDSLKNYYVKWNLNLPDTIMPTAQVTDCTSWKSACSTLKDLNQCVKAQINYRPINAGYITLVDSACAISGSVCIENQPVAKSQGACQ
jgi:hypothetical protein